MKSVSNYGTALASLSPGRIRFPGKKKILKPYKLNKLIKELLHNNGISQLGKPEILKYSKSQTRYSLRIDKKNRLIFEIRGNILCIASCLGHYD